MRTTTVKSALRVLDLLELMSARAGAISLSEAARRLDIPKSSASGLLRTLVYRGYVELGIGGYQLAARFREGGWIGGDFGPLKRVAQPIMARLVREVGETAFLGIMTPDWEIEYIAKAVSDHPLRYDVEISTLRPAYCVSIGHVLLADQPDDALDHYLATRELRRVTPHTETDPDALRARIAAVRASGYAPMANSNVVGAAGVAAAVRPASGRAVAGLSVIAPQFRFEPVRDQITAAVVSAAAEIGRALALPERGEEAGSGLPRATA